MISQACDLFACVCLVNAGHAAKQPSKTAGILHNCDCHENTKNWTNFVACS